MYRLPYSIWQCSKNPEHRGWRGYDEPRGTCDHCLARTSYEQEIALLGRREDAPPRRLAAEEKDASQTPGFRRAK